MDCYIPKLVFTKEQRAEHLSIVRRGATCLRKWHAKAYKKGKITQRGFRGLLFHALAAGKRTVAGVRVSVKDVALIQAVRDIEYTMLCAYSGIIKKVAVRYCGVADMGQLVWTEDDVYAEATAAMVDAIYGYTREDVKLSTFAYVSMRRRIWNASYGMGRNHPRWPLTLRNLKVRYEAEVASSLGGLTYDELIEAMGLSDEESKVLTQGLREITATSGAIPAITQIAEEQSETLELDEADAIEAVCLESELNRAIVAGLQGGHWGWRQEVATHCGVTRQYVGQKISRLRKKILANCPG